MIRASGNSTRHKAVWGPKRTLLGSLLVLLAAGPIASAQGQPNGPGRNAKSGPNSFVHDYRMDDEVARRSRDGNPFALTKVIVSLVPGAQLPPQFQRFARKGLDIIHGVALELPNSVIRQLAAHPSVFRINYDRPAAMHNYRTSVTVGARVVQNYLGYTGAGIGVAIIDSGVTSWHDDLTNNSSVLYPYGNQRVSMFVDFVNGQTAPYDDNGHGSHVAGTLAGNGYDSNGQLAGVAPGASLVSLKVLDQNGLGTISNIIAAMSWVAANSATYNIRVVNLSVGAGVDESYWTDPLTLAAKALTDQGITVVAAAGNFGKNAQGQLQWGGITAPGNAPWVLTVGASTTNGTVTRWDDAMASYSSSGPTAVDFAAKPDLVAPGTGTVSLAVPGSTLYSIDAAFLVDGQPALGFKPYLALSGTSMAAPVVSGTVALMLQANPLLTPNLIKAILQYTAQSYPGYGALREGAGFLNSLGAVRLAKYYANPRPGDRMPAQAIWSRQIIWGNHLITGGYINPASNAWATNIVWGSAKTLGATGDNIVWGTDCSPCDNIVWGMSVDNIVWGTAGDGDNIVWGMSQSDNIVWGMDCGGADCDNVVWGMTDPVSNIVWGTAAAGDNIVWGMSAAGNIVWGMSAEDNIVWGMSGDPASDLIFPDAADGAPSSVGTEFGDPDLGGLVTLPSSTVATPSSAPLPGGGL